MAASDALFKTTTEIAKRILKERRAAGAVVAADELTELAIAELGRVIDLQAFVDEVRARLLAYVEELLAERGAPQSVRQSERA